MTTKIVKYLLGVLALALLYFLAALFAAGVGIHEQIMPFWVPAGIALAALLRFGVQYVPGVVLGNLAFNIFIVTSWQTFITGQNLLAATAVGSGAGIQAVFAAWLIERWKIHPLHPQKDGGAALFVLVAGPLCSLINATIGTCAITFINHVGGSEGFWSDWANFWLGDSFGAIVVTPLLLALLPNKKDSAKTRQKQLVGAFLGLIVLVVLVNHLFISRLHQQLENLFKRDAQLVSTELNNTIQRNISDLTTLDRMVDSPRWPNMAWFSHQVEMLRQEEPSVRAFSWNPVVSHDRLSQFELATSQMLQREYHVFGDSPADETMLVPVQMVAPLDNNAAALGFNLLSTQDRRDWVYTAQREGRPVATSILSLKQAPDEAGLLILHPVSRLVKQEDLLDNQRELIGFMVGVLTVPQLLEQAMKRVNISDIEVRLYEGDASKPFFSNFSREEDFAGPTSQFDIQVAQHTWRMEAVPGPDYYAQQPSNTSLDMQILLVISAAVTTVLLLSVNNREQLLVAEVSSQTRSLAYQARHDELTGLPNRVALVEVAEKRLAEPNPEFSILFIDLDRFKTINDSLGHQVGDELLRQLSQALSKNMRDDCELFRTGGDEFILVVSGDAERARAEADRLLVTCALPLDVSGYTLQLTASIGISLYPEHGTSLDALVKHADSAMYKAKEAGKNQFAYYTEALTDAAVRNFELEQELRRAIHTDELVLFYQPQFDLETLSLVGAEALVRWQHPERGLLAPGHFIPLAEETQLIVPLGWKVIELACAQMKAWQQQQVIMPYVAVNISPPQLMQADFVEKLNRLVDQSGVARERIELEITETAIMRDPKYVMSQLDVLSQAGYRLALDDFGTGYSSLNRLKGMPLDRLKIDQSFTRDIGRSPKDEAIIITIIALGRSLGMEVLAEGVEEHEQQLFLSDHGCNSVQGYLYGRPVPAEQIALAQKD